MNQLYRLCLISVLAFVLYLTPTAVQAGSASNQGDITFYHDDSSQPEPSQSKEEPISSGPGKHLTLPQAGEKRTSLAFLGGVILIGGSWLWWRQRKEGSSET